MKFAYKMSYPQIFDVPNLRLGSIDLSGGRVQRHVLGSQCRVSFCSEVSTSVSHHSGNARRRFLMYAQTPFAQCWLYSSKTVLAPK